MKQYRLRFEVLDCNVAAKLHDRLGDEYWPRVQNKEMFDHLFTETEVLFFEGDDSRWGQINTLKRWAEDGTEPVRNVTIEVREVNLPEWEKVK